MEMKRPIFNFVSAGVLAFAASMTIGVGVSNADTLQTEGSYPTHQACQDAGPGVKATTPPFNWNNFWCVPDPRAAGHWRLVLSNN
ncbi:hypothetical protein A9W99_19585 [Mycobacterium sp. 1164966.3]|uniref:hypothetical protein n=1 Tax=Mycobacterium sp. 1164966.3 TaxID=1856861 RepID=UPI0007FED1FF|nr:hypothetical protein A9W99_19585 [Mycobacterium sp. 1164966.3]